MLDYDADYERIRDYNEDDSITAIEALFEKNENI